MKPFFRKYILLFTLSVSVLAIAAQQNHFIYLQTENKQPFYVKLDKKILSSSTSGYLIIPKLADGTYTLTLGFPKNEWPEQKVTCAIDKKDAGYILKNFGDKGWGLFNWQSLNVVMADKKPDEKPQEVVVKKEPPPVVKEEPVNPPVTEIKKEEPIKPVITITKLHSNKTADGIEILFTDSGSGSHDTVRIFLPITAEVAPAAVKEEPKQPEVKEEKPVVAPTPVTAAAKEEAKKDSVISIKTEPSASITKKEEAPPQMVVPEPQQPEPVKKAVILNSDCKAAATEDDFMKLRKKMVAEDNDDDMVNAARKVFKTKCFTVEQIKNLSVLFLKDDGRYKFFDAAYPFVSDSYNFINLQKLLTEEYYINRFKAMVRQ